MLAYGAWLARHARLVVVSWVVAMAAAFALTLGLVGDGLFAHLQQKEPHVASESHDGNEHLIGGNNAGGTVLIRVTGKDAASLGAFGPQLHASLAKDPAVADVRSPYGAKEKANPSAARAYVSAKDDKTVMFAAALRPQLVKADQEKAASRLERTAEKLVADRGDVAVGGSVRVLERITDQVEIDLRTGEGIAMPLTVVVMIFVFGGFVAAGLPMLGAIAAIAGGLLSLLGFSQVMELDATTVNIVTILGLGLSIDYGLLIVSRYREELARAKADAQRRRGANYDLATARTVASAGRTVLFSGLTVAISVAGLMLFPASVTKAVGLAGLSVVLVACFASLTLVPACARLAAGRLARRNVRPDPDTGRFASLAHGVQRHVWVAICGVVAVLLVMASPLLGMRQVSSTGKLLPADDPQRTFLTQLKTDFPALAEPDVTVVTHSSAAQAQQWAAKDVARLPQVKAISQVRDLGDGYAAVGIMVKDPSVASPDARDLVTHLREHRPSFRTYVTGQEAKLMDYSAAIRSRAPVVAGVVALATLILLFGMTGSLILPLKALLFNALSLAASLGVLVWIFTEGHLQGVLGYTSNDAIESVVPVILLAFGFGLAMDYEVFLLARVVEAHQHGASDADAVALGLQRSGRIITSAALLMVIVMLGFAAAQMIVVKQMGVGLALSIILDATLVRMILVPATMTVMGRWNWWAPGPLRRLHERYGLRH